MAYDILSLQRNRGAVQAKSRADEQAGRATLKYIDIYDLIPSEDNFYSMSAIEELASLIEISGGVKQPGLVVPVGGGKYRVIAGHRRRLASIFLVEQGKEQYRKMPCMVEEASQEKPKDPKEAAEAERLREIDEGILLIATNGQRDKTDWERVQEVTKLRELLEQKRQFAKIPGQTRKIIAEQLGTTPAQVGRYESIAKHLTPEFQSELAAGRVNISVAYELSTLPEVEQAAALQEYHQKGALSLEDARRRKVQEPERAEVKTEPPAKAPEAAPASVPAPSPAPPTKPEPEKREPDLPEMIEGINKKSREWTISQLKDLLDYCGKMTTNRDRSRDWSADAGAIMFAIDYMEGVAGSGHDRV